MVPAIEALQRPLRRAALGRHLAGVGAARGARRPARSSATTSAASPTPTTSRSRPPAGASVVATHIRLGPRVPDPEPVYDEPVVDAVCRLPARPRPRRPRRPASRASGSWSTPASTSARPSRSRSSCCGPTTGWPRSAGRCSCRRRTSGSSATWSAPTVDDRREASHAAHALGHRARLPDPAGPRRPRGPADRRRDGRRARRPRGARRVSDVTIPVTCCKGDDEVVLRDAVRLLVDDLVGDEDRSLDGRGGRRRRADRRRRPAPRARRRRPDAAVPHRASGWCSAGSPRSASAASWSSRSSTTCATRCPSTLLVLEWRAGKVPKALLEAVTQVGGAQVDTSPGRKVGEWVAEHLAEAGLKVDTRGPRPARHVGRRRAEPAARASSTCCAPPTGPARRSPPPRSSRSSATTAACRRGTSPTPSTGATGPTALELLQRMIGQGERHPFQVLSTLHSHFARMLRLDGADVAGEKEAAELLGMKGSTFPAKKALGQARRLGHERIVRADRPAGRGRPRPAGRQGLARPPRARGAGGPPGHDVEVTC